MPHLPRDSGSKRAIDRAPPSGKASTGTSGHSAPSAATRSCELTALHGNKSDMAYLSAADPETGIFETIGWGQAFDLMIVDDIGAGTPGGLG